MQKGEHLEVALIKVPSDTSKSELIGTSRDPDLAAIVHKTLCDELERSMQKVDDVRTPLAD